MAIPFTKKNSPTNKLSWTSAALPQKFACSAMARTQAQLKLRSSGKPDSSVTFRCPDSMHLANNAADVGQVEAESIQLPTRKACRFARQCCVHVAERPALDSFPATPLRPMTHSFLDHCAHQSSCASCRAYSTRLHMACASLIKQQAQPAYFIPHNSTAVRGCVWRVF